MKKTILFAAGFALLAGPALAQYGGGGQSSGGPLGSYARKYGYGGYYGGYGYYAPPVYGGYYGGPAYYGGYGYYPYYGGGGAIAAGVIGGLALGALGARSHYHPRRFHHRRVYRRW